MRERPDLNDVALFVRVVEEGTFAKVARDLGIPTSTVSRALARLESALGTRLLERTTRAIRVTAEGKSLFQDAAGPVSALDFATRGAAADRSEVRGTLRVTAAGDVASTFLSGAVAEFTKRHPNIEVELVLTGKNVDLVRDGFDVAIRAGVLRDSTLMAKRLARIGMHIVASPTYLAEHGTPKAPKDLQGHNCILFRGKGNRATWNLVGRGKTHEVEVGGSVNCDDMAFVHAIALQGQGLALLPRLTIHTDLAARRLVRVLEDFESQGSGLYFVHAPHKQTPRKIEVFREFVTRAVQDLSAKV